MSISNEGRAAFVRRLSWWALPFAILSCVAANAQSAHEQLAGVWRIEKPVFAVRTTEGREPPLKPEAMKVYRQHVAMRKQGDTSFDSATWCASAGLPRLLFIDSPLQILVHEPYVTFLHEWNWWARVVYLDGALTKTANTPAALSAPPPGVGPPGGPPAGPGFGPPPSLGSGTNEQPGPMGFSKGHWEGDTLVIETTQLLDTTLIDGAGIPHSDALKLTEHVRLRSPDVLENRIRIDDPATFTQPWETVVSYKRQPRGTHLQEDVCLDRIKTSAAAVKE